MSRKADCDPAFTKAVMALARERDGKALVEMIFAGHPKTEDEWVLLAMYLEGELRPDRILRMGRAWRRGSESSLPSSEMRRK